MKVTPKHVLFVGKDAFFRLVITRYLQSKGYRVARASSSEEALALAKSRKRPWHALITDHEPGHLCAGDLSLKMEAQKSQFTKRIVMTHEKTKSIQWISKKTYTPLTKPVHPELLIASLS